MRARSVHARLVAGFVGMAASVMAASASAGTVTSITLGDFTNASVLDFNSAPVGNISGTSSLFTSFGISSVSATFGFISSDGFGVRPNASRALWANDAGLTIVDPNAGDLADIVTYTIKFADLHTKVGFGVHDQQSDFLVEFFSGATAVGSTTFQSNTADLFMVHLQNSDAFDTITISVPLPGGFAIDNITIEASEPSAVAEPASLALLGLGLAALAPAARRRKARA